MFRYSITIVFCLLIFCPLSLACDLAYDVRSADLVSELCVTIEKRAEGTTYRSIYRNVKQVYHYNIDGAMTGWEYADSQEDTHLKATRNAHEIMVRGTSRGKQVNKFLAAGSRVWLQNSEFGLLDFLRSKKETKDFIMIAPEDLTIKRFRATRAGEEDISWNDRKIRVVKSTARLRGVLSLFWQATYWHRFPDMTFLRYKADGMPGVPKVDIQLVREKSGKLAEQ